MELDDLDLSVRASHVLKDLGIKNVEDLLKYTPGNLANARGWGRRCLLELREALAKFDLCLAGDTVISSEHGIELVKEIPLKLDEISTKLRDLHIQVRDLLDIVERIRISSSSRKI